jgi:hypothetical protein
VAVTVTGFDGDVSVSVIGFDDDDVSVSMTTIVIG